MPQVTRSQFNAIEQPVHQVTPLAEIDLSMGKNTIDDAAVASELKGLKAAYRGALGIAKRGRKSRSKKKDKQGLEGQEISDGHEASDSITHSPVPEATRQLLQSRQENAPLREKESQSATPIGRTTRRQAAKAQAAEEALSKSSAQNTSAEKLENGKMSGQYGVEEQQFSIPLAALSPIKTLAEVEEAYGSVDSPAPAETDDSFVEQITSRSPAKPVTRIEDSLEALDQLEEALEAIGEVALAERIGPAEKVRDRSHTPKTRPASLERSKSLRTAKPETVVNGLRRFNSVRGEAAKPGYGSMRVKPTTPKPTSALKKATSMNFSAANIERKRAEEPSKSQPMSKTTTKRPISLLPPKETVRSTKPLTRPTFELPGEAIARKLKEQREARLAQRTASEESPPQSRVMADNRCKSTKPPTKAVFELPGEALSRRKREALEARLKIQEEEERHRREFKAKPIRKGVVPDYIPRETAASRARQSRIGLENMAGGELVASKRTSSTGANIGAHRSSCVQPVTQANVSAPRAKAPVPIRKQSPTTHGPSMSGRAMPRTITADDVQAQRQRAKEIYERDAKWTEDMGRERRDREAAAKRAREEAAERGRQASREWAEKQMARKIAENDKMGPGYGPGGQLGLRS